METERAEWQEKGRVPLPSLLDEPMLDHCRRLFDDAVFAPKVLQSRTVVFGSGTDPGTEEGKVYYPNDATGHQGDHKDYQAFFAANPLLSKKICSVLGSKNLWYCDHEIWYKPSWDGTYNKRTMLHQDTLALPAVGLHLANLWICFEDFTPAANCLAVVPGTHKGPHYLPAQEGGSKRNLEPLATAPRREGAQEPLVHKGPPVPPGTGVNASDIAADRETRVKAGQEVMSLQPVPVDFQDRLESWDLKRGDVLLLHPRTLHGGAPLSADHPARHTLVLRVFGDDCTYKAPTAMINVPGAKEGDHFSSANPAQYFKIWGPEMEMNIETPNPLAQPVSRL